MRPSEGPADRRFVIEVQYNGFHGDPYAGPCSGTRNARHMKVEKGTRMRQMRKMIVTLALVSVVELISWRAIPPNQTAATPVIQDGQAQATPGVEVFQLNAPAAESECFEVDIPCGWNNCGSLGVGYSCGTIDRCCCPGKSCT